MGTVPLLFDGPKENDRSLCAPHNCQNSNIEAVVAQLLLVVDPAALHFLVLHFSQEEMPIYDTRCFSNCFVIKSSHTRCPLCEGSKSVHSAFEHVAVDVLLGLAAMAVNAGLPLAKLRQKTGTQLFTPNLLLGRPLLPLPARQLCLTTT